MKRWTQAEFDTAARTQGRLELGTGDFTEVDFAGAHNIVIGPCSVLGHVVHLGMNAEIGAHTTAGDAFRAGGAIDVGEQCHFGLRADLGEAARIGRGCCFATGVRIGWGTAIADDVALPRDCTLFGVEHADGRTLMKISSVNGATLYAFASYACGHGGTVPDVWVSIRESCRRLDSFQKWAISLTREQEAGAHIIEGAQLVEAGRYVRERFALMGLCES